jgi:hypothetical protein
MTKKIYYEKVGRKYVPVAEYDSHFQDSLTKGNHLVMCYPGGTSRRFNIDPDYAGLIAAARVAEDAISKKIVEATEIRRNSRMPKELTPGQRAAWDKLVEEFGDDARQLEWPSAREAAESAVKALQEEAKVLYSNEAVCKAYDHFILMCKLTKEQNVNS